MSTRAEALRRQVKEMLLEAEQYDRLGDDVYEDGSILVFNKRFGNQPRQGRDTHPDDRGKTYTYVALKAAGLWYVTGREGGKGSGYSWDRLVDFLADGVKRVYVVTELEEVA